MSTAKRHARRLVAIAASAVLIGGTGALVSSSSAIASSDRVTATTGVNVRSAPDIKAKIIGGLYPGYTVVVRGAATNGWTPVTYNGRAGWVSSKYLHKVGTRASAPAATGGKQRISLRTSADLNVRTGPGTTYRIVTVLATRSLVSVTGSTSHGFTEIVFLGEPRWVSSQYLSKGTSSSTPEGRQTALATVALDVRSVPLDAYYRLAELPRGAKVTLTGVQQSGRAQIVWGDGIAWVTARYLTGGSSSAPSKPPVTGGTGSTPSKPNLPAVTGSRYATTALMIRTNPDSNFTDLGDVATGTRLSITGTTRNGRAQIIYQGAARWVTAQYLSTSKPASGGTSSVGGTSSGGGASSSGGTSSKSVGAAAVAWAKAQVGRPYSYGGGTLTGPSYGIAQGANTYGFDCSGLVRAALYVASGHRIVIPRTTYDEVNRGSYVSKADRQPGDLIFFKIDGSTYGHVGMYIGNGQMVQAPRTGQLVQITSLNSGYYNNIGQTTRRMS